MHKIFSICLKIIHRGDVKRKHIMKFIIDVPHLFSHDDNFTELCEKFTAVYSLVFPPIGHESSTSSRENLFHFIPVGPFFRPIYEQTE